MRKAILLAVAALAIAPPALARPSLPLKRGFYARVGSGCATHGSIVRYSALLTFHGDGLNDTSHDRRFVGGRSLGSTYEVQVASRSLDAPGRSRRLTWLILVFGPDRFHLAGTDDGANLTDDYVYCGTAIP